MGEYESIERRSIGFIGGTFDPIHFGHINLALALKEVCGFDEVLFCPTPISPLKKEHPIPIKHRLRMVELAIEHIPGFLLFDYEATTRGPHYTIDTIKYLIKDSKKRGGHTSISLILGEDITDEFMKWKDVETLVELATPIVGNRFKESLNKVPSILSENIHTIPMMEISATEIRKRLKNKLYCGHMLPAKVLDYIYHHQLYFKS